MSVNDKYSCHASESFPQPIELQLSIKKEHSGKFFLRSRNLNKILNILKKKRHSLNISDITEFERRVT